MNKWKISFIVAIVLLVGTILFGLYITIDSGITITYQQVTIDDQNKTINALGQLIVKGSKEYNQKDILHLIRQSDPEAFIVEEGNSIHYEGAVFRFKDEQLISVSNKE